MSAAQLRMALYSMSIWAEYALAANTPDHWRHCRRALSGPARSSKGDATDIAQVYGELPAGRE